MAQVQTWLTSGFLTLGVLAACERQPVAPTAEKHAPGPANPVASVAPSNTLPERAYVVSRGSGSVVIVDRQTSSVVHAVAVGIRPTSLAVSPDGETLVTTVSGSSSCSIADGALAVISLQDETLSLGFPVGTDPWDVHFAHDGLSVFVSDGAEAVIRRVEVATGSVLGTAAHPSLDTPHGIDLTPSGEFLYVANVAFRNQSDCGAPKAPENITVLRTSDLGVEDVIDLSADVAVFGPWDITVLPDGTQTFTNDGDEGGSLFEIDSDPASPDFNNVVGQFSLASGAGPRGLTSGVTSAGLRVFAGLAETHQVVALDPQTGMVQSVSACCFPWRVSLTPDGAELWVSLRNSNQVLILDASTLQEIGRVSGVSQPADIGFSKATPAEQLAAIHNLIIALEDGGALQGGQATGLASTLIAAGKQCDMGNVNAAIKILEAFERQVEGFVRAGVLSSAQSEPLLAAAEEFVATLNA